MIIIGITGSIGSGKTFISEIFKVNSAPVFDADKEVHLLLKNAIIVEAIKNTFGLSVIKDGKVDRQALGNIVFFDSIKKKSLEEILYSPLRDRINRFIEKSNKEAAPFIVLDIPLLFEQGFETYCDTIVVASADKSLLKKRALARPGMTEEKYDAIITFQMPLDEKVSKADFVIDTSQGNQHTIEQVNKIIGHVQEKSSISQ